MFKDLSLFYLRHNRDIPAPEIRPRPIPYFDLTLVFAGDLYYTVGGREIVLSAGDAILIPPGVLRQRDAGKAPAEYFSFNFYGDDASHSPLCCRNAITPTVCALTDAADALCKEPLTVREKPLLHLLAALLSLVFEGTDGRQVSPLTANIRQYLEAHYTERITLTDIRTATFFSPVYSEAVFRREMGMPIITYLLTVRIREAKKLLREGNLTTGEVGAAVGIPDANYFSRIFKKRTGETPGAYRRRTGTPR